MSSKNDKFYLKLALNLAKQRKGLTGENPSVGCVIVKDNKILSLSNTSINGRPHAEANAIRLANTNDLKGSTIYVTLEPCTHHGKTPPCTKKIIESIKKIKDIPIIGFPRNTNLACYKKYSNIDKLDCITLDYNFPLDKINELNDKIVFQGNLDPKHLLKDSQNLSKKIEEILFAFRERPHIFNLGHGVLPETDPNMMDYLIKLVKDY